VDVSNILNLYQGQTQNQLNEQLLEAAKTGNAAVIQSLLAAGADINAASNNGNTAFMYAASKGHTATVEVLIANGADINAASNDGMTAFIYATNEGHTATVKVLIAKGADINAANNRGNTALMYASINSHTAIVKVLIAKRADINAASKRGMTALMLAAVTDHMATVEALIANGADINTVDNDGATALTKAAFEGHTDIAFRLLCAMSPEQIDAAIVAHPELQNTVTSFNQAMLANQKKLFNIFSPCFILGDGQTFLEGQELKMLASQLSQCFPSWYTHKIASELQLVTGICSEMKTKREAELNKVPALFSQLPLVTPEEQAKIIKALGEQYTFTNYVTHLGYLSAVKAFGPQAVSSCFSGVLNQASAYFPSFSFQNQIPNNKRSREEESEPNPTVKKPRIGSSSSNSQGE